MCEDDFRMSGENSVKLEGGLKIMVNRYAKATPDYSEPSDFRVGINQTNPLITDTDLAVPIPISDGTVCDGGDNTLTGSSGGDNSTDNTSTFKDGAGVSDVTAQNLIGNSSSATKVWSISDLSALGIVVDSSEYASIWFYVLDSSALGKFLTSGTCLELKLGSDSSNYYSITKTVSDLVVGWNLISDSDVVSSWSETGTVGSPIDYFEIEITTNNATDTFSAGDVVYDLLRQWALSDTVKALSSVTVDEDNMEIAFEGSLTVNEANGFQLDGHLIQNGDGTPVATDLTKHDGSSKSSTEIFTYTIKNRIRGIE